MYIVMYKVLPALTLICFVAAVLLRAYIWVAEQIWWWRKYWRYL